MIEFEPGTVYDVSHLRPFDMELAKAGHPLADRFGRAVRCVRYCNKNGLRFDYWDEYAPMWMADYTELGNCAHHLRLAPLALKDDRALHVGDTIELVQFFHDEAGEEKRYAETVVDAELVEGLSSGQFDWRWPKD